MTSRIHQIEETTKEFQEYFGSLTAEELNRKPAPETWSIAQNIDHLIVINESYFPVLSAVKSGDWKPPLMAKFGFITTFLGKTILKASGPDRRKKMKTFPVWEPTASDLSEDILQQFVNHQNLLKEKMEAFSEADLRRIIVSSPANKYIAYSLEAAFDIIVAHEQRHLVQAKETLSVIRKSSGA